MKKIVESTRSPEFRSLDSSAQYLSDVLRSIVTTLNCKYMAVYVGDRLGTESEIELDKFAENSGCNCNLTDEVVVGKQLFVNGDDSRYRRLIASSNSFIVCELILLPIVCLQFLVTFY